MKNKPMKTYRRAFCICSSRAAWRIALGLLVLLSVSISIHTYLAYTNVKSLERSSTFDTIENRLDSLSFSLERFSILARERIVRLSSNLALYSESNGFTSATIEKRLKQFAEDHPEYCQVYYESAKGTTFSIIGNNYAEAKESIQSFIKTEPQFSKLLNNLRASKSSDIQISGLLEYTYPNGVKTPFVHVIAPVEMDGVNQGYLALTLDLDYVLDEIRNAERSDETVFLSDHDGKFLASNTNGAEFSLSIKDIYSEKAVAQLFSPEPIGHFEEDGKIFSYQHIVLPGIRQGSADGNFWVLVSVASEDDLFRAEHHILSEYTIALLTSLLLILVIGGMIMRIRYTKD